MNNTPIEIWIPVRMPGLNEIIAASKSGRGRYNAYGRMKAEQKERISPFFIGIGPFERVRLAFEWHEPNRRRDKDNICAGGRKFILDAMVEAGVIKNDGWKQIDGFDGDEFVVSDKPGVKVKIMEVNF